MIKKKKKRQTVLENTLYIPSFKQNIFSVQCATNRGSTVKFKENTAELKYKDGTIFKIEKQGHLYFLNSAVSSKKASHSLREWHEILGHCNVKDVLKLENVVDGMNITDKSFVNCDVCIKGKMSIKAKIDLKDSQGTVRPSSNLFIRLPSANSI